MMSDEQILKLIEEQQKIQMANPPSSAAWQAASAELHRLIEMMTGKKPKDACGKRGR